MDKEDRNLLNLLRAKMATLKKDNPDVKCRIRSNKLQVLDGAVQTLYKVNNGKVQQETPKPSK